MTSLTIDTAPRDLEGLKAIPPMQRYRLAITVQAIPTDNASIQAFSSLPVEQQATTLLAALQRVDAQRAAGGGAPAAPMGAPAGAPQGMPMRQPDVGPPGLAGQPAPQQMGQPAPQQMPPPVYAPQGYGGPPNGAAPGMPPGFQAPPGMGPPPQQMAPQGPPQGPPPGPAPGMMPQGAVPPRTPSTASDPGIQAPAGAPVGGIPGAAVAPIAAATGIQSQALADIINRLEALKNSVDTEVPGVGDIQEVHDAVLGVAAVQQVLAVLILMVYEHLSGLPRAAITAALREEIAKDPISPLIAGLKDSGAQSGKG